MNVHGEYPAIMKMARELSQAELVRRHGDARLGYALALPAWTLSEWKALRDIFANELNRRNGY